ncbi:hypothetical protein EDC04DRAFT_3112115 [Pisolithus marmoratus]|nr:hypothetical protein EDC04DRAFT_3112115 [Pisolithus marmoratus]
MALQFRHLQTDPRPTQSAANPWDCNFSYLVSGSSALSPVGSAAFNFCLFRPEDQMSLDVKAKARAGITVLEVLGLLLAIFRFWFRYRIRRLWWEDAWAFAAFLFAITYLTGTWLNILYGEQTSTSLTGFWMYSFSSNLVVWFARLSILFSVARIIYPSQTLRRIVFGIAFLFSLLFVSFIGAKLWYYCHDLSWMGSTLLSGNPPLPLGTNLVIYELTTDFISDAILIALPIKLLWSVKLPTRQRRMIMLIFASGITVTLVATCRGTFQILGLHPISSLLMDAVIAFSSIMCNLLVFVTFLYRYGRSASPPSLTEPDDDDDDYTTPARPRQTTQFLTTVEVGGADCASENVTSTWSSSQATSGTSSTDSSEQRSEKTSS